MDVIYAYLDDKKTLYRIFNTALDFNQAYINKEKVIQIEIDTLFIYLYCNPLYLKTILKVKNVDQ
jgi:hypothetical protein